MCWYWSPYWVTDTNATVIFIFLCPSTQDKVETLDFRFIVEVAAELQWCLCKTQSWYMNLSLSFHKTGMLCKITQSTIFHQLGSVHTNSTDMRYRFIRCVSNRLIATSISPIKYKFSDAAVLCVMHIWMGCWWDVIHLYDWTGDH